MGYPTGDDWDSDIRDDAGRFRLVMSPVGFDSYRFLLLEWEPSFRDDEEPHGLSWEDIDKYRPECLAEGYWERDAIKFDVRATYAADSSDALRLGLGLSEVFKTVRLYAYKAIAPKVAV